MLEKALVERFIGGRELTVGVLGDAVLPVVEIVPEHAFYDFHSKYAKGGSRHLVPADIGEKTTRAFTARPWTRSVRSAARPTVASDVLLDRAGAALGARGQHDSRNDRDLAPSGRRARRRNRF